MIDDTILATAASLLAYLREQGQMITTAESCTGGLIAAALTHVPGSSDVVDRGFVTYSNAAKTEMLGVPAELIERVGAVSQEVAAAMAEGALQRSQADVTIAVTGIAGPGGGSPGKPVGLVWFGLARRGEATITRHGVFPGDRAAVRSATVSTAFAMVRGETS
jgi:nicotinamide-nucleotide amidase